MGRDMGNTIRYEFFGKITFQLQRGSCMVGRYEINQQVVLRDH